MLQSVVPYGALTLTRIDPPPILVIILFTTVAQHSYVYYAGIQLLCISLSGMWKEVHCCYNKHNIPPECLRLDIMTTSLGHKKCVWWLRNAHIKYLTVLLGLLLLFEVCVIDIHVRDLYGLTA